MKKALLFISGFVTGIVATILVAMLIANTNQANDDFPLAWTGGLFYSDRILVLLINYDDKSYYDDQKIKIPSGKCARQIGTYRYTTKNEMVKTVPAVVIE